MKPVKVAGVGLAAWLAALPAAVSAQYLLPAGDVVHERIFEVQPLAGWFQPDDNTNYPDGSPLIGVRGALNNSAWWSLEAKAAWAFRQKQVATRGTIHGYVPHPSYNSAGRLTGVVVTGIESSERTVSSGSDVLIFGGDLLLHLSKRRLRPFVTIGGGFIDDMGHSVDDPQGPFSDPFLNLGAGIKAYRRDGWGLRLDVNDIIARKDDLARDNVNAVVLAAQYDFLTNGGLDRTLGREPYDPQEYRGRRWLHNVGVSLSFTVPFGWAWKDEDRDKIATRFDQCPTTAPSVVVDAAGCGIDSDKDGVFDGLDDCAQTPVGATVDRVGCPSDSDGDTVLDGIDQDDNTPPGALVDASGRHKDSDEDGVFDGLDACEGTAPGAVVDSKGCAADPLEDLLLRGEPVPVAGIRFEPGTDQIDPISLRSINRLARLVERWTGNPERPLRVAVVVNAGANESRELAQRRADAVRMYLLENFFGMGENNLVAQTGSAGGGDTRVEMRVLGPGSAPKTYEAPADATTLPPAPTTPPEETGTQ